MADMRQFQVGPVDKLKRNSFLYGILMLAPGDFHHSGDADIFLDH